MLFIVKTMSGNKDLNWAGSSVEKDGYAQSIEKKINSIIGCGG